MVTGVLEEDRALTRTVKNRIKDALQAEIVTKSQSPDLLEAISISFPEIESGKPAVRIHISYPESEDIQRFMDNFIAEKTEHHTAAEFIKLKDAGEVEVSRNYPDGYHGRCDTTITASSTQSLIEAVGSMLSNPIIKQEFLRPSPVASVAD
jgi:hypothetical protein